MTQSISHSACGQFDSLRDQLKQQQGLPFLNLLSRDFVEAACRDCHHFWRERVYIPSITLAIFLSQILADNHSCDDAVERFQKYRSITDYRGSQRRPAATAKRGNVCPRSWLGLGPSRGPIDQRESSPGWLFHGPSVKIADGSTVPHAGHPGEPGGAPPRANTQKPGVGFPSPDPPDLQLGRGDGLGGAGTLPGQANQRTGLAPAGHQRLFQPGDIFLADRFFGRTG